MRAGDAAAVDAPVAIPGMGGEAGRHGHRGRRDGGTPPRPGLPRVAAWPERSTLRRAPRGALRRRTGTADADPNRRARSSREATLAAEELAEETGLPIEPAPGAAEAVGSAARSTPLLPRRQFGDQRDILGGAGQNVIGLAAGMLATFATQIVMTRTLGAALFGVVTVTTQFAFIASHGDAVRHGRGERPPGGDPGRPGQLRAGCRSLVRKSAVDLRRSCRVAVGLVVFALSSWLADTFVSPALHHAGRGVVLGGGDRDPVRRGDLGLPRRHAWAEDHAAHAVHLLDRPAGRLDPVRHRRVGRPREDGRGVVVRLRAVVGGRVRPRVVGVGARVARVRPAAPRRRHPPGTNRRPAAVRHAANARRRCSRSCCSGSTRSCWRRSGRGRSACTGRPCGRGSRCCCSSPRSRSCSARSSPTSTTAASTTS